MTSMLSAPFAARIASMLYESLLLFGVLAVFLVFPHILLAQFAHYLAGAGILWAHLLLVTFFYFAWFWQHGGQTLAMKTWRIRLVSEGSERVALWQAITRYFIAWLGIFFAGAGLWWAFVDRDRQFLHDRLAGTRLVRVAD